MANLDKIEANITTLFLYPMVVKNREKAKKLGIVNAYIKDVDRPDLDEPGLIYLLCKPDDLKLYQEFFDAETEDGKADIIDDYDYPDGYVVTVFQLPKKYHEDYKTIMEGRYSEVSENFKENFPQITKVQIDGKSQDQVSLAYMVMTKISPAEFAQKRKLEMSFEKLSNVPMIKEYWEDKLGMPLDDNIEFWDSPKMENEILDIAKIKSIVEDK